MNMQTIGFIALAASALLTALVVFTFRSRELRDGVNSTYSAYTIMESFLGASWVIGFILIIGQEIGGLAIMGVLTAGTIAGGLMGSQLRGDAMSDRWGYRTSEARG